MSRFLLAQGVARTNPDGRSEIADLAGLLAWRRCVQASFPHRARNNGRNTVGGLRSPALQSRGGDGWRFFVKFHESRSVFPCTKSAMIVVGAGSPAMGYREPRKIPAARKNSVCTCKAC